MAENVCVNRVAAVGISTERAQEILSDMAAVRDDAIRAGEADPGVVDKMLQAAKELNDKAELEASKVRLEAVENIVKADNFSKSTTELATRKKWTKGKAFIENLHAQVGGRVHAYGQMFRERILQVLDENKVLRKRADNDPRFQEDVIRGRALLSEKKDMPADFDKDAWTLAKALHENDEFMRQTANDLGADIGWLDGFFGKQWHDATRIVANMAEHAAMLKTHVNWLKTFDWLNDVPVRDRERIIDEIIPNIQNNIAKKLPIAEGITPNDYIGHLGKGRRVASSVEKHRILKFNDAEAWIDYNRSFGQDGILGGTWENVDRYSRIAAQLEILGTKPESSLLSIIGTYRKELGDIKAGVDKKVRKELDFWKKQDPTKADNATAGVWRVVTGQDSIPENLTLAAAGSAVRNLNNVRLLGQAVIASLSDPIIGIMTMVNNYGYNIFQAWGMQLGDVFRTIDPKLHKEFAGQLEAIMDGMTQYAGNRFEGDMNVPGRLSRMSNNFFKVSGLTWWTNNLKRGAAVRIANMLGEFSSKSFGDLNRNAQRTLTVYGLDKHWDVIREHMTMTQDGKKYVIANRAENIPDNILDSLIGKEKIDGAIAAANEINLSADEAVARLRRQQRNSIEMSVRTMMAKEIDTMVLTPDSKTRMYQAWKGTRAGTVSGEVARSVMQFKSFPISFIQKVLYPMLLGNSERFWSTNDIGNRFLNTGLLVSQLTLAGYMAMEVKRMAKGEKPYFMEPEKADWNAVAKAAFLQGGGAGIIGDFFFAEVSRFGGGEFETMLGPTAGIAGDIIRTGGLFRQGELKAADILNLGVNYTPYANIFYIRGLLNYSILYSMQEALSPGWMRRREQKMKQEGREFIYPPSQHALRPIQRIQEGINQ